MAIINFGAGSVSFGGLMSGIDTSTVIKKLVDLEKASIEPLTKQKTTLENQNTALGDIISKLKALDTSAKGLDTAAEVGANSVTSSVPARITAVASGAAIPGFYAVTPTTQAKNDHWITTSGDADGVYNSGNKTLTIDVNGYTDSLSLSNGMTFDDIVSAINASAVGSQVQASVQNVGSGGTPYLIEIQAVNTGSQYAITLSGSGVAALNGFTNSQVAANAAITVDGKAYSRSTNTISDVIPGVTMTIVGAGAVVNLTVTGDSATQKTNFDQLTSDFNSLGTAVSAQLTFDATATDQAALYGDSGVRYLQTRMQTALNKTYNGVSAREMGFSTNSDGTVTFDAAQFDKANSADPTKIGKLLAGSNGLAAELEKIATDFTQPGSTTSNGVLVSRQQGILDRIELIDQTVDRINLRADTLGDRLKDQFNRLELSMARLKAQGDQLLASLQRF